MTVAPVRPAAAGYARFLASAVVMAAAVGAIGYLPTQRLGGAAAVRSLLAGCALAVAASAAGGVPIALAGPLPAGRSQAALLAMTVRLLTVATLGAAAAASGRFATRPLAIWTVISYLAQLVVDSRYAMRAAAAPPRPPGSPGGTGDPGRARAGAATVPETGGDRGGDRKG
jgi:hypothetical protein